MGSAERPVLGGERSPQEAKTKILVTGSCGLVGRSAVEALHAKGYGIVPFDVADSGDILDLAALRRATSGCDAIIHSAALLGRPGETADEIMAVNVRGTWNVLLAARECAVAQIVFLSSVDVLGVFKGERPPDYLPLDEEHPCRPTTPYGISKLLGEELCEWSAKVGGPSVLSLRPPGVWSKATYGKIERARAERPSFEWDPYWEYGAFIDVRDLAQACVKALTCELEGFHSILVASADLTTSGRTGRELVEFVHPEVEWRGGAEYDADPYHSLIDIEPARRLLGWSPRHSWKKRPQEAKKGSDPISTHHRRGDPESDIDRKGV